jgi:hypothetical protein
MIERSRCKCPRCVARRRNLYLAVSGASIAVVIGYFALIDQREVVPDASLDAIGGTARNSDADGTPFPAAAPGSGPKQTIEPRTSTSPESGDRHDSSALKFVDPELSENHATEYSSDPYGLLPVWLTENAVEAPRKPPRASAEEGEGLAQNRDNPLVDRVPGNQEASVEASSEPKREISETAGPGPEPKNEPSIPLAVSGPEEETFAETALASLLVPAEPLPLRPKTTTLVSQSARKPVLATEDKPDKQSAGDLEKASEPRLPGALASFVAIQANSPQKGAPPPEHLEPRGYITLESKHESLRNAEGRNRSPKQAEHRPKTEDDPVERSDNPPKSPDDQSKRADAPAGPANESADLQRFALNFVRTEQTGSVPRQHQFYAESVHFYGEGDLSWPGVEAATRRHNEENQSRRFAATAPAIVKGPVDGGFYVVDQPVSWSRTDGGRITRGRSMLRLRVVSTGRDGWKITSIEEVGR